MHHENLPVDTHRPNPQKVPTGILKTEPAGIIGTVSAAIVAVLGLLTAFGFDLTAEQSGAIVTAFAAIAIAVQTIMTRNAVASPATVAKSLNEAAVTGDAETANPFKGG